MRIRQALRDMSVAIKLFGIMGLLALTAGTVGWSSIQTARLYNAKIVVMQRASERAVTGEQINALINAVVMDSRGIYMAKTPAEVEKFGVPLLANLTRIEERTAHWAGWWNPTRAHCLMNVPTNFVASSGCGAKWLRQAGSRVPRRPAKSAITMPTGKPANS